MRKIHARIFSYTPNPRIWKALITAELVGVNVEVRGDNPKNLKNQNYKLNIFKKKKLHIMFINFSKLNFNN